MLLVLQLAACSNEKEGVTEQATSADSAEIVISAAASLENAMNELKPMFEKENENIKLSFTFGGSGSLQQQISQGAPVDVFFSAAEDKFQKLVDEGLMHNDYQKDLLKNTLVLIAPTDSNSNITTVKDLAKMSNELLAIGEPESVPAGKYAKEALENLDIWSTIEPKVIYGKDVSQVLTYVAQKNTDFGFVYRTDAISSDKIKILQTVGSNLHDPIIYPVGVLKDSKNLEAAVQFYNFLQTEEALAVFDKYGFTFVE